jgi:acyl carrier protein
MDKTEQQVIQCFAAVFPSLTEQQIQQANLDTVEEWDSIAGINLIAVIEEEFGISIDAADLPQLVSFNTIVNHVRGRQATV